MRNGTLTALSSFVEITKVIRTVQVDFSVKSKRDGCTTVCSSYYNHITTLHFHKLQLTVEVNGSPV